MKHKLNKLGVENSLWNNIRANKGSGKKPTKQMLEQEAKIKAQHAEGGYITNDLSLNEYGNGGYIVKRSSERKGKTHVVIGPDGTKKYFGDSKLGQHPNDPERKKAFYARHKHNLANNPYFRAFARKTWAEGGEIDEEIPLLPKVPNNNYNAKPNFNQTQLPSDNTSSYTAKGNSVVRPDAYNDFLTNTLYQTVLDQNTAGKGYNVGNTLMTNLNNPYLDVLNKGAEFVKLGTGPVSDGLLNLAQEGFQAADKTYFPKKSRLEEIMKNKYGSGGSIHIKPENKGKFTAWAKSHGMGVQEAASHVMANKDNYSSTIVKRANFAKNAAKFKHADGGMVQYPGGGETEGGMTTIPVTNKFYNQPLANQTTEIANYASANPNVKAGTFSVLNNTQAPVTKPNVNPLGYDNQGFTPSVNTNNLPAQYNKKDWGQQYVPNAKSNYYTYYPTGQTYTPEQYNTYKNTMQPTTAALPTNAMGGYIPKYSYVNGKFIPTHAYGEQVAGEAAPKKFADTNVGNAIVGGGAIAPTLQLAGSFVGDNNSPLGQALDYGAQGASAGMMFGPWGAAIGGGLGLAGGAIKGYFDQEEQAKKQRELDQQKKNISTYNQLMGKAPQSNLAIKTNTQAMYAEGGMKVISRNHPNPQEEVEGGETAITPNGRNIQFRGPKHNNGGIKTNLPSGTRIFSDRIIYPG